MHGSYDVDLCNEDSADQESVKENTASDVSSDSSSDQLISRLSWKVKIFFSFGHIYNDLCASIWFSYTLIFFQMQFKGNIAGILILLGQVADALATPFVGFQSDRNDSNQWLCRYGRRKTWHLLGTILVSASFPFIFNKCLNCEESSQIVKLIYYGIFIVLFQFGWAAVQVGHVSLITDLSTNTKERVELNAYRQAATVASSICVYTITWFVLSRKGDSSLKKEDSGIFTLVVYIVCAIGVVFSILFHIFVPEPNITKTDSPTQSLYGSSNELISDNGYRKRLSSVASVHECTLNKQNNKMFAITDAESNNNKVKSADTYKWSDWLKDLNFYKVAFIYMVSRLFVNLTQVYTPLFLQRTLLLPKASIAIIPFVTYISGFIWSFVSRFISAKTGSKILLVIGCVFGLGSCVWNNFGTIDNESFKQWQVYGAALLFGIGSTTMLIASLAITSDLIGINTLSSAFVFGTMSFFDKILNGSVVVVLEQLNPYKNQNEEDLINTSVLYYKQIVVFVSGVAVILCVLGVLTLIRTKLGNKEQKVVETNNNNINSIKPDIEVVKY